MQPDGGGADLELLVRTVVRRCTSCATAASPTWPRLASCCPYDYDERREGRREHAYARLLHSALDGDQRLFARADGVEEAWRVVAPVLQDRGPVTVYQPGSWGPAEADALIAGGAGWHRPEVPADG